MEHAPGDALRYFVGGSHILISLPIFMFYDLLFLLLIFASVFLILMVRCILHSMPSASRFSSSFHIENDAEESQIYSSDPSDVYNIFLICKKNQ